MSLNPEDFKPIRFICKECGKFDWEHPSWDRGLLGRQPFCERCCCEGDEEKG